MSSLRLALKQSLQESGSSLSRSGEDLLKRKKKKPSVIVPQATPLDAGAAAAAAPPRKRGRPRKHPLPDQMQGLQNDVASIRGDNTSMEEGAAHHASGLAEAHMHGYSSEEYEFSVEEGEIGEEDDSCHRIAGDEEIDTQPLETNGKHKENSDSVDESNRLTPSESKHVEVQNDLENVENDLSSAASKIQNQWKKRLENKPSKEMADEAEGELSEPSANAEKSAILQLEASSEQVGNEEETTTKQDQDPTSEEPPEETLLKKKKLDKVRKSMEEEQDSSTKATKTVPAPSAEVLDWVRSISVKRARKYVMTGLRVKVRFATKVKRDGKMFRKKRWYGGRVSTVSNLGTKIRIQYDDGTVEVTRFPDDDVVVDETSNQVHDEAARHAAEMFAPPLEMMQDTTPVDEAHGAQDGPVHLENNQTTLRGKEEALRSVSQDSLAENDEQQPREFAVKRVSSAEVVEEKDNGVLGNKASTIPTADNNVQSSVSKDEEGAQVSGKRKRGRPPKQRRPEMKPLTGLPATKDETSQKSKYGEHDVGEQAKSVVANSGDSLGVSPDAVSRDKSQGKTGLTIRIQNKKEDSIKSLEGAITQGDKKLLDRDKFSGRKQLAGLDAHGVCSTEPSTKRLHIHIGAGRSSLEAKSLGTPTEHPGNGMTKKRNDGHSISNDERRSHSSEGDKEKTSTRSFDVSPKSPRHRKPKRKRIDGERPAPSLELPAMPDLDHGSSGEVGGANLVASKGSAFERKEPYLSQSCVEIPSEDGKSLTHRGRTKQDASAARPGRRAAQQANERISSKQELVTQGQNAKKQKGKKRERRDGDESDYSEDDSQKWVQCDRCRKWRIIPSFVVDSLPNQWYCSDNIYDPKRASCDVPEQTQKQVLKEKKKMKKRQQRILMEAAANADAEGQETTETGRPETVKEKPHERARSPRPDPEVRPKRQHAVEESSETASEHNKKSEKKASSSAHKKGRTEENTENGQSSEPTLEVRRGRGRPRRHIPKEECTAVPQGPSGEVDNLEWVQCEKCEKWRKLPSHISADELPEVWYCSMNTWNPDSASCSAPEDKADGLQDTGVFGNSGNGKLSFRSLIFGNTGRKANRPVSERTRAAESLFNVLSDEDDSHPTVMYANSSAFVCRSKSNQPCQENPGISIFELMNGSHLWTSFQGPLRKMNGMSDLDNMVTWSLQRTNHLTYDTLPQDVREPMKDLVEHSLASKTLSGDDVLLEVQGIKLSEMPAGCERARTFCTINVIVTTLCELVKEGRVECVQMSTTKGWILSDWNPRYRVVAPKTSSTATSSDLSNEARKDSRCMKISKPWKKRACIQ